MAGSFQALRARLLRWEDALHRFEPPIERMPALAWLAVAASLTDLLLNRLLIRLLDAPHALLLQLQWWGDAARNLAAVAGFVALTVGCFGLLLHREGLPLWRRIAVASVVGIFTPLLLLSCVLPAAGPFRVLGPLTAVSGAALTTQLAMAGLRRTNHSPTLWASVCLSIIGLVMFTELALTLTAPIHGSSLLVTGARWLRRGGEPMYLALGLLVASYVSQRFSHRKRLVAFAIAALIGALAVIVVTNTTFVGNSRFSTVLEGALDLHLFVDSVPALYPVLLAAVVTTGMVAAARSAHAGRQGTGAALLLLAAGLFPRTPSRVLMLVLGAALLARTAVALQQRGGHRRISNKGPIANGSTAL